MISTYTSSFADSKDAEWLREEGKGPGVAVFLSKAKINHTKDKGTKLYKTNRLAALNGLMRRLRFLFCGGRCDETTESKQLRRHL